MDHAAIDFWDLLKTRLQNEVEGSAFQAWLKPLAGNSSAENLEIEAPSKFHLEWVKEHYLDIIQNALQGIPGAPQKVVLTVSKAPVKVSASASVSRSSSITPAFSAPPSMSGQIPKHESFLNPKYSFENFVVGNNNRFAQAACMAVAESPAKAYNPLFIYGGVGLGKTHLMQAIGHQILLKRKKAKIIYISSEKFTNQLIDAIQNRTTLKFRNMYRTVDALLIDDIQFFSGKEHSQEEFFHTFNTLHDTHKQIVMSSDRPAKEIANIEERLVSRFEWGLVTDLQPPDFETRIAILRKKAELSHFALSDEIATFLATKIKSNIRKLEGSLIRVVSYSSLSGLPLTVEMANDVLQDILQGEEDATINMEDIQRKVAEYFDIRLADMKSQKRPKNIAFPRQIAMYLARTLTKNSLPAIGEAFGGRDHTTVLHAYKSIESKLQQDYNLKKLVASLTQRLKKS